MATTEPTPDYSTPPAQLELLDKIEVLQAEREKLRPEPRTAYRDDVLALATRVFADLEAEKVKQRRERIAELRQKLVLEASTGGTYVYLNDADGLTLEEVQAAVIAPAPPGYQDAISGRVKADDMAARAKLEIEIRRTRIRLERLEVAERNAADQRRLAELDAEAKSNGKAGK